MPGRVWHISHLTLFHDLFSPPGLSLAEEDHSPSSLFYDTYYKTVRQWQIIKGEGRGGINYYFQVVIIRKREKHPRKTVRVHLRMGIGVIILSFIACEDIGRKWNFPSEVKNMRQLVFKQI